MKSFINSHDKIKTSTFIGVATNIGGGSIYRHLGKFGSFNTIEFIEYARKNFNFEYTGCIYHDISYYLYYRGATRGKIPHSIVPASTLNFCNGSYKDFSFLTLHFTNHLENGEKEKLIFEFDTREQYNGFDFQLLRSELTKPKKSNKITDKIYIKTDIQFFIEECKAIVKAGR